MLQGKCIIVTGATGGIGREIALCAARNGAHVGINFRSDKQKAEKLSAQMVNAGFPQPMLLPFDAAKAEEIEQGIKRFIETFHQLDGLVNNAAEVYSGHLAVISEEEIRAQIDSALIGPILCCRAALPFMLSNRKGCIVNIGSVVTAKTHAGQSIYAAAKGGILSFSRALASECGKKNIRVNCLQPGPVDTEMLKTAKHLAGGKIEGQTALRRLCTTVEIAETAVFLLSDQSSGTTGACFNVDGGYSIQ
jgi:3-oxoacyl-[acyl-carrier protein] reductase